jgi:uncharacterized repeat protein (TIGR03803 family)
MSFTGTNGRKPFGSLIYDGTFLYGMTQKGGTSDSGVIFKIKPDGTGFNIILDFSNVNSKKPFGTLIFDGTFLYGMTYYGPSHSDQGIIFKIKTDGTGYVELYDFTGFEGRNPTGSLITDGTFLYGMTNQGGIGGSCQPGSAGCGVIFKVKTDGTGFVKLMDLTHTSGGNPHGSLISDGTSLYGLTSYGGVNDFGTIFKINTDGTGFQVLFNFSGTNDGKKPYGTLVSDGTFLYGMTRLGGISDSGVIFKIKPDGTGFSKIHEFGSAFDGRYPFGGLLLDSGTFLYGMTELGGVNSRGTIFKIGVYTDIEEYYSNNSFQVFPSPCNTIINIKSRYNNAELKIIDIVGKIVKQEALNSRTFSIDVSDLQNGIYFVNLSINKMLFNKIIVVQH